MKHFLEINSHFQLRSSFHSSWVDRYWNAPEWSLQGIFKKIINMIPSPNDNNNHSSIWCFILNETCNLVFSTRQHLIFIHSRFPFPAQHFNNCNIAIIKIHSVFCCSKFLITSPQEIDSPDLKPYRFRHSQHRPGIIDDR